jgi:DNA primase
MAGIIDQIKERVDIVDLIASYLKLQKSGINYKARCPFHNEKSGSFFVSPDRQIWHCFGCGLGGDAFGFVKQIEGVEFPEALRILAARAGIELHHGGEDHGQDGIEWQSQKTKLLDISELATKFFEKQLWQSDVGAKALDYLRSRGLTDESIKNFRLGYAPDSWDALSNFLQRSYASKEIFDAGLVIKKDGGGYYDRFRSRIMFPIGDLNGQVVGFSARVFGETAQNPEAPKYVNTPQTLIYDKSRVLYGLDKAKLDIRRQNRCLVVEGNMDVIMSHQAGAAHVVASSGTALTEGHLRIIKRYTDNLDLCFDADDAGTTATDRGVDLALAKGFNVGIISINESDLKDPADYVKKYGSKWLEYATKSQPFMEFYYKGAQKLFDVATALGKKLFVQKLVPFLASMANKIEQAHWVGEIALVLKTKEELLYNEIESARSKLAIALETESLPATNIQKAEAGLDPQEESLLSLIIKKPALIGNIKPEDMEFLSAGLVNLFEQVAPSEPPGKPIEGQPLNVLTEPTLAMKMDLAYLKSQEMWKDFKEHELDEEFGKLIGQIRRRKVSARLNDLEYEIKTAEKAQNKERLSALVGEFSKISKQLAN